MTWRLCQIYPLLNTPACSTDLRIRQTLNKLSSFSKFCAKVAKFDLAQLLRVTHFNVGAASLGPLGAMNAVSSTKYRVAEMANSAGFKLKRTAGGPHGYVLESKRHKCVLCCCLFYEEREKTAHTRQGHQTKNKCTSCQVFLCTTKRWTAALDYVDNHECNPMQNGAELTCFDAFHRPLAPLLKLRCSAVGLQHSSNAANVRLAEEKLDEDRKNIAPEDPSDSEGDAALARGSGEEGSVRHRSSSESFETVSIRRSSRVNRT